MKISFGIMNVEKYILKYMGYAFISYIYIYIYNVFYM